MFSERLFCCAYWSRLVIGVWGMVCLRSARRISNFLWRGLGTQEGDGVKAKLWNWGLTETLQNKLWKASSSSASSSWFRQLVIWCMGRNRSGKWTWDCLLAAFCCCADWRADIVVDVVTVPWFVFASCTDHEAWWFGLAFPSSHETTPWSGPFGTGASPAGPDCRKTGAVVHHMATGLQWHVFLKLLFLVNAPIEMHRSWDIWFLWSVDPQLSVRGNHHVLDRSVRSLVRARYFLSKPEE